MSLDFFYRKKVFVTGYNGFKGSWISKILVDSGASVCGYALRVKEDSLFTKTDLYKKMKCIDGDIRDYKKLSEVFNDFNPEIVIHLAAQPIVIKSYQEPRYTFETNVMGTVNILECVRNSKNVKSFLNVTTDKVYENNDSKKTFIETDKLNGYDPYSNSKSCSELITSSYKKSFFVNKKVGISTARAGNVIGGGDNSEFRIIPDCIRAAKQKKEIIIRNPKSIRPYQHVLDVCFAYLMILEEQYKNTTLAGNYNIGPHPNEIIQTEDVVKFFCKYWGEDLKYMINSNNEVHESSYLKLDCTKFRETFNWSPVWNIDKSVEKVVEFEKINDGKKEDIMEKQIKEFRLESKYID